MRIANRPEPSGRPIVQAEAPPSASDEPVAPEPAGRNTAGRTPGAPRRGWALRSAVGLIIGVVVLLGIGTVLQTRGEAADLRDMPPSGRLVQVDGRGMHLWCAGSGGPTALLVSGAISYSLDWTLVQPTVATATRVCSYDRAGLGWSEPNPAPRTASRLADELGLLVAASGEQGPFVLVGHSYGGIIARLFAARHPIQVSGLVLVDAVDEEWLQRLQPGNPGYDSMLLISEGLATANRFGVLRLIGKERGAGLFPASMPFHRLPPEARDQYVTIAERTGFWTEVNREQRAMHDSVLAVASELGPLGDLPLVVMSADDPAAPQHLGAQQSLVALSSDGRHVIAEDSGHFIQVDRPDRVIAAIADVLEWAHTRPGRVEPRKGG